MYLLMIEREEVRVLDINSEFLGVPTEVLMENAGWALAQEITSRFGSGLRIAILCGKGNNGGDGFVAARALTKSNRVRVFLALPSSEINTPEARINFEKVEELHKVYAGEDLSGYDVLVDALLGVGSRGEPKGAYADMVKAMNASGKPVVSADVPSGLGSTLAVRPMLTVTFHDRKAGMDGGRLRGDRCSGRRHPGGRREVSWDQATWCIILCPHRTLTRGRTGGCWSSEAAPIPERQPWPGWPLIASGPTWCSLPARRASATSWHPIPPI